MSFPPKERRLVPAHIKGGGKLVPAKIGGSGKIIPAGESERRRETIVLENGPTRVSLSRVTGNILEIKNKTTGHVYSNINERQFAPYNPDGPNYPGTTLVSENGTTYRSPFGLYLFWRHFGFDHYGCVLKPKHIHFSNFRCDVRDGNSAILIWSINRLDKIQWYKLYSENSNPHSGLNYYETNFAANLSGDVPTSIPPLFAPPPLPSFIEARVRIVINTDGTINYGQFQVKRLNENYTMDYGLYGLEYPIIYGIKEINQESGERNFLAVPHMEGKVICNPYHALLEDTDSLNKRNIKYLSLFYPTTYDSSMQFIGFYSDERAAGLYLATHDETMKAKSFIWDAEEDRVFNFHVVHWSDDVCSGYEIIYRKPIPTPQGVVTAPVAGQTLSKLYDPNPSLNRTRPTLDELSPVKADIELPQVRLDYYEYVPRWKDYQQNDYWVISSEFQRKDPKGKTTWRDVADKYKEWVRGPQCHAPWVKTPRIKRDTFGFYKYTGFAVWFLGSEFALSRLGQNYIEAFHKILRQPTDGPWAERPRVLHVMGWDWHFPFSRTFNDGNQYGNKKEYWKARFGSEDDIWHNLDEIRRQGDFITPYVFAHVMCGASVDVFPGWTQELPGDDPGSPWENKRLVPDSWKSGNRYNICPATTAYRNYILNRDTFIRNGNYEQTPPTAKPLDGIYHDIGFTFEPQKCFMCEPILAFPPGAPKSGHDHFSADNHQFQVGTGGFLNRACREILTYKLYNCANPSPNAQRLEIFGTEGITEIFIDLVDCSGNAVTMGSLKPLSFAKDIDQFQPDWQPSLNHQWDEYFTGFSRWIYKRWCAEVPMLSYVYNPLMTLRIAGHGNLSKPDPANLSHCIGQIFYWLNGKIYLSGMITRLDYDICPVDVLSSMDQKAPTYMRGWQRLTTDPEVAPWPPMDDYHNPTAGKHPFSQTDFNKYNRTYGDPAKERFIRMLAFLRTYVVPDFIVYGEMIHPGTIPDDENKFFNFDYEYYFAMGASDILLASDLMKGIFTYVDALPHRVEHKGHWEARPLLTNAWRNIDPEEQKALIPGQESFCPAALYAIINSCDDHRDFHFRIDTDLFDESPCTWQYLRTKPDDESTWDQWNVSGIDILKPQNGWIRISLPLGLDPHEVILIKITRQKT